MKASPGWRFDTIRRAGVFKSLKKTKLIAASNYRIVQLSSARHDSLPTSTKARQKAARVSRKAKNVNVFGSFSSSRSPFAQCRCTIRARDFEFDLRLHGGPVRR